MASTKKYSALEMLRMGEFNCAEFVMSDAFKAKLEAADAVLGGTAKRYQENQGPLRYPTEIVSDKLISEEVRIAKKHKNFLRRERARQKKREYKASSEEEKSTAASSGYNSCAENSSEEPVREEKVVRNESKATAATTAMAGGCKVVSVRKVGAGVAVIRGSYPQRANVRVRLPSHS